MAALRQFPELHLILIEPWNRQYAALQKEAFESGLSAPDFAPDNFEVDFKGRFTRGDLSPLGLRVMGY